MTRATCPTVTRGGVAVGCGVAVGAAVGLGASVADGTTDGVGDIGLPQAARRNSAASRLRHLTAERYSVEP